MSTPHAPAAITVDRLEHGDLDAALAIQAQAYPAFLRESAEAFASRLDLAQSYCLAARRDGALIAYLLAHGWAGEAPPPVDSVIAAEAPCEVLFIHDLAVAAEGRGAAIGSELIARVFALAAADGLTRAELIAVAGAASYWQGLGFREPATSAALAGKVAAYGPEARWMVGGCSAADIVLERSS